MSAIGDTNPSALLEAAAASSAPSEIRSSAANPSATATAGAGARVTKNAATLLYPSQSISKNSTLPSLVKNARDRLMNRLGGKSNSAAKSPRFSLDDPTQFKQIPYASLYIDCSWADLLFAYRASLLEGESPSIREEWHRRISDLFTKRHNVYTDPIAYQLACQAVQKGESPKPAAANNPLPSNINVNSTLSREFVSPPYLRSEHNIITALSARTCFDLFLTVRKFPPGSLVAMSAINIPDMSAVLRDHGLIPIPIDINQTTLAPDLNALENLLKKTNSNRKGVDSAATASGRVVAVLVAHIYGRRFDMSPIASLVKRSDSWGEVDLIEDMAESFSGFEYAGHAQADLTLLSFGSIKICTGFGCGIARVRDAALWGQMSGIQRGWTPQARSTFFNKCMKNTGTMAVLNVPLISNAVMQGARAAGFDHKALVVKMLRGFPDKLMERLRQQPSSALLSMLHKRLHEFSMSIGSGRGYEESFQRHQDLCDLMIELLPNSPECIPGHAAPVRNHWLFPVLVSHIDQVLVELNRAGCDAYKGATQLALVPPVPEMKELGTPFPAQAADLMDRVIYLPVHKRVPINALVRMALVMRKVVEKVERSGQQAASSSSGASNSGAPQIPSKL